MALRTSFARAAATIVAVSCLAVANTSLGDDRKELAALLAKAGVFSQKFDDMMKQAAFTLSGTMHSLDSNGAVDETLAGSFRFTRYGPRQHVEVIRYTEDGEDKTTEARKKVAKDERARREKPPDPDDDVRLPFLPAEQPKYKFSIVEVHPRYPSRIRIGFVPKEPAKSRVFGSAWLDRNTGVILSMGVSPSETSGFVDYVKITLEFGAKTPMGPAVSTIAVDAKSSFLFFRKHWKGAAELGDYRLSKSP